MMRTREARIRTFMQLELEACLEEVNWMIRWHNCEALNCPQEEYPARLLPTPPPSYIDNLQSRLIKVRKGIFPASLKMTLKTKYPLPERRPAPETSVQPDDVIGEHRAREKGHRHSAIHRRDAPRRGRYGVRGTRNAATVARDRYGVRTRSIASRDASGGGKSFSFRNQYGWCLDLNCTSTE